MSATAEKLFSGLDLGKAADFSVLATVGRRKLEKPVAKRRYAYSLRWLQSWELGTRYTATAPGQKSVIGDVKSLYERPQLRWTTLAADYTGVGIAVIEQLQAAKVKARLNTVCITAGHSISTPEETKDGSWHVPKKELVSTLVVLLENDLFKWQSPNTPGALPLIGRFEKELQAFREHVTKAKNVTFGAEQSQHDDIVMSVALCCWLAERSGGGDVTGLSVPDQRDGTVIGSAPSGVFATGNRL